MLCALTATGCEQKHDVPTAPEPRGLPPISVEQMTDRGALPHAEHPLTTGDPHGGTMPPGHPSGGAAAPGMEALSPGEIAFDKKTVIAGALQLDAKVKDKVSAGDVIYLVVRAMPTGETPGLILAVKRIEATSFPMPFQLDSRDAMVVGTQLKPPVMVTARVDKDGDAMTKQPGDVTGSATVKSLPLDKLKLNLDTVL